MNSFPSGIQIMVLSANNRTEFLQHASTMHFHVLVIGGGITGAGIALDAEARGMKVLLIEKNDFASGTSSKSTKLIHGGLRYLKQLEFRLVRKVGMERAVIHRLAPHLVKPVHMLLPIYKQGSLGKFSTSLALWMYDVLAKVRKEDAYKMLGKIQTQHAEPLLNHEGLIGGALYKEYRTDDARLTMEVMKKAAEFGAVCINYTEASDFLYENNHINGVSVTDKLNEEKYHVYADVIINAGGPWADELRRKTNEKISKTLFLTKGVHFVIPKNKLPLQHAVYFDVPGDKRMIFAIPRDETVYIGTTDTAYTGSKENITVTKEDVTYLLHAVNATFLNSTLTQEDILSSWAGLRPLIHEEGKPPSEVSRNDEIFISDDGLITIAGGKLTGYRKMAESAVDIAAKHLEKKINTKFQPCTTDHILLHGADFSMPVEEFIERRAGEVKQIGVEKQTVSYLVNTYGTAADKIIETAFEYAHKIADPAKRILFAELKYCVENEMVLTVCDFLIRRTGLLYFARESANNIYPEIAVFLKELLQLTEQEMKNQMAEYEKETALAVQFL